MEREIYKLHIHSTDPRLNRHINHDPKSKEFTFDTTGLSIVNVTHQRLVPIFDQGQVGSCTGNAGMGAVNTSPFVQLTNPHYSPDETGALHLYADAERIDGGVGYPPEDNGSSGLSVAKALKTAGMISTYQHTFTLDDALKALSVYPIITGTNWYEDMFTPDADGRVHPTGKLAGGHEYEGFRVDADNKRVWFANSWGKNWGVNGCFYMTFDDYATLLAKSGDVTVLIPITTTPPTPMDTYKYFKSTESTGKGHTVAELKPTLMHMLDTARGIAGVPFVITSGMRTAAENKAAGGVSNSAHLTGEAADVACADSTHRWSIVTALLQAGFNRLEIAKDHIHADISKTLPQNIIDFSSLD